MSDKRKHNKGNPKNLKKGDSKGNKRGLTAKQIAFCEHYIQTTNASESARLAGYAKKSSGAIGHENLKKPEISAYIEKRLAEIEEGLMMQSNEVLQRLTKVGRREEVEHVVVTTVERSEEWVNVGTLDRPVMKKISTQKEVPVIVQIPAKLGDTNKALELLGKRHKLFTDKVEQDIDMDFHITVDYGDDEDDEEETED